MKVKIKAHVKAPKAETAEIKTDFIKLDALLKFMNLVATGGEAKAVIQDGLVRVNGVVCTERGKKIYPGAAVAFGATSITVVRAEG